MGIDKIFENKYLISLEKRGFNNAIIFIIKDNWVFRKEFIYDGIILEPIKEQKNTLLLTSTFNESFDNLYSILEKIILFNETKEEKEKELAQKIEELKKSYVDDLKNFTLSLNSKNENIQTLEAKVNYVNNNLEENNLEDDNS